MPGPQFFFCDCRLARATNVNLMRNRWRYVLIFMVGVVMALGAWAQSPQDKDLGLRKPSRHSGLPVVGEFERPRQSDAEEARRQKREKLYENSSPRMSTPYGDPGELVDGQAESTYSTIIDYIQIPTAGVHQDPQGIPVTGTAVVIGTILSGNSFMSKHRTVVYSDYQVRVDEILKQGPKSTLAVGGQATASRAGGAIHFPSGHRTNFLISGQGLPEIGSRYVLYLWKPARNQPVWEIVSGYQLKDGRVYPLDEVNERSYDGMSETVFLDLVKKAIGDSPDMTPRE
jgi:hypothetical protein